MTERVDNQPSEPAQEVQRGDEIYDPLTGLRATVIGLANEELEVFYEGSRMKGFVPRNFWHKVPN